MESEIERFYGLQPGQAPERDWIVSRLVHSCGGSYHMDGEHSDGSGAFSWGGTRELSWRYDLSRAVIETRGYAPDGCAPCWGICVGPGMCHEVCHTETVEIASAFYRGSRAKYRVDLFYPYSHRKARENPGLYYGIPGRMVRVGTLRDDFGDDYNAARAFVDAWHAGRVCSPCLPSFPLPSQEKARAVEKAGRKT